MRDKSDPAKKHDTRLQALAKRLEAYLEDLAADLLSERARNVVVRIALSADRSGRAWLPLSQLQRRVGCKPHHLTSAIREAADHDGPLLLYVEPESADRLPWLTPKGSRKPPPDAWGFWVPLAAMGTDTSMGTLAQAFAVCRASVNEHRAHADAFVSARNIRRKPIARRLWEVRGHSREEFRIPELFHAGAAIAANDPEADNDLPAEAPATATKAR